jgi:hypothetical protein
MKLLCILLNPLNVVDIIPVVILASVMIVAFSGTPENAVAVILLTEDGITIIDKLVQPWNALAPIIVTEAGITIDVRLVQFINAPLIIPVTVDVPENVTDVRRLHPENA